MTPPIVEVADSPAGLIEIKVRDAWGVRIGFLQAAANDLDDDLLTALKAWQARRSHCCVTQSPAAVPSVPPDQQAGPLLRIESSP